MPLVDPDRLFHDVELLSERDRVRRSEEPLGRGVSGGVHKQFRRVEVGLRLVLVGVAVVAVEDVPEFVSEYPASLDRRQAEVDAHEAFVFPVPAEEIPFEVPKVHADAELGGVAKGAFLPLRPEAIVVVPESMTTPHPVQVEAHDANEAGS